MEPPLPKAMIRLAWVCFTSAGGPRFSSRVTLAILKLLILNPCIVSFSFSQIGVGRCKSNGTFHFNSFFSFESLMENYSNFLHLQ